MRSFWMTLVMTAAAAAACSENNDADAPACGAGSGPLAGSAGAPATTGGETTEPNAGAAGSPPDCGSGGDSAAGDGGAGGQGSWKFRALTYNSGLAPDFEPFTTERGPLIQAALAEAAQQLDLLCVQEYWAGDDFDALKGALAEDLPHAFRQAPKPGSGACSEPDLVELGGCLQQKCPGKQGPELIQCAQVECYQAIQDVDGGCLGCFLEHLGEEDPLVCLGDVPSDPALFGGAFDVGLFSRYPLLQQAALEYDAYFVRASALYARVDVPGLGPVDTFCTHLGSSLGAIPYHGPHGSWDGEHSYQVAQLLGFISAKANGSHPVLVLGDLNTGPASAGPPPLEAELPLDYQLLLGSGLTSAVTTPQCTLCSDNVLRGGNPREIWLDHALLKGFSGTVTSERALSAPFMLGAEPDSMPLNLSDHYGLRVELAGE